MKHKLLFVISELDKETSGHYWHIYELLQEVGKKMEVVVFAETGENLPAKGSLKRIYVQTHRFLPLRISERAIFFINYSLKGYKRFYIHQSIFSSILAAVLGKIIGFKTYFWHCGKMHLYEEQWGRKSWPFRLNLKLIDYLVTGNQEMKNYYHRFFTVPEAKIKILPGWVNLRRFQSVDTEKVQKLREKLKLRNKKVVLFVHWLSARKGSRFLPEIINKTAQRIDDVVFIIIGGGPDEWWLKEELNKRNLEKYARLLGKVSNQKIPQYFRLADVFIMPSREEELGRVHLETIAAGRPLVAFKTEGVGHLQDFKPKILAAKHDIDEFVNLMMYALKHEKTISRRLLRRLEPFSLVRVSRKFIGLLREG